MKIKLLFLCIIVFTASLSAQGGFAFGVKGGINYSNASGGDLFIKLKSKLDFHVGGVIEYSLTDKFLIQTEPMYSRQGYVFPEGPIQIGNDIGPITGRIRVHLDYINVPLFADYEILEGFSLQAGPQLGFGLGGHNKLITKKSSFLPGVDEMKSSITGLNVLDFGVLAGLQYELPSNLFFQLRYVLGLTGIGGKGTSKNRNAQLSIGYKFN